MSLQFKSGGGGGIHTVGYEGSQLVCAGGSVGGAAGAGAGACVGAGVGCGVGGAVGTGVGIGVGVGAGVGVGVAVGRGVGVAVCAAIAGVGAVSPASLSSSLPPPETALASIATQTTPVKAAAPICHRGFGMNLLHTGIRTAHDPVFIARFFQSILVTSPLRHRVAWNLATGHVRFGRAGRQRTGGGTSVTLNDSCERRLPGVCNATSEIRSARKSCDDRDFA